LGNIVAYFKYQSTKQINAILQHGVQRIWQRNYCEHIVRDGKSLFDIRQYIKDNPLKWDLDCENHVDGEIDARGLK
jgi:REP element-mobilizing transposase RayT